MFARILKEGAWWTALLTIPVAFALSLTYWFLDIGDYYSAWIVTDVQVIDSEATSVSDLPEREWRKSVLPNFTIGRESESASVWYRMELNAATPPTEPWAVYVVGPSAKYAVFVNGRFVGESGHVTLPMPQNIEPSIFRFPADLLHSGVNRVHLHIVSERRRSVLQSIQVGPDSAVTPSYRSAAFALVTFKQITVGGLLAIGIVMLVLTRARTRDAAFGWYAVALLFMAAHIGIRLMASVPFGEPPLWKNLVDIALIGYIFCAVFFLNRYLDAPHPRIERWLTYWSVFGTAVLVLNSMLLDANSEARLQWFFNRIWLPVVFPVCIYQAWLAVRAAHRNPNIETRLLALICCIGIVVGICDGAIAIRYPSSTLYLPYAMAPVICVFWFLQLRRFVGAVNSVELARNELEQRVHEKTKELAESMGRLKDLEREQALSAERERIMRDVHDGIGGQLVQALSIATSRPELKLVEDPLRSCLEELRLIVDSIEPVNGNLGSVLGTLRMRMTRRLNAAAIQLRWRVDDIPTLEDFGPTRVLHVSRIVHEAIANALKHSRAKQITLSARLVESNPDSVVAIEIADDGLGARATRNTGRGLENMRRRAAELDAQLTVEFGTEGTTVRLVLPARKF